MRCPGVSRCFPFHGERYGEDGFQPLAQGGIADVPKGTMGAVANHSAEILFTPAGTSGLVMSWTG